MKRSFRLPNALFIFKSVCIVAFCLQHPLLTFAQGKPDTTSHIQLLDITTGTIDTVLSIEEHFEAPNWHPGNYLILNSKGKLHTLDLASKKLTELNTGFANQCNNDHGISPD